MKKILLVFILLLAAGCSKEAEIRNEHERYLLTFDWHIKSSIEQKEVMLDYNSEYLESLEIAGLDLEPYKGREAIATSYLLKERQINGDKLTAVIYEIDGEIIGGHGILDNWSPGLFELEGKERLIKEKILKKP